MGSCQSAPLPRRHSQSLRLHQRDERRGCHRLISDSLSASVLARRYTRRNGSDFGESLLTGGEARRRDGGQLECSSSAASNGSAIAHASEKAAPVVEESVCQAPIDCSVCQSEEQCSLPQPSCCEVNENSCQLEPLQSCFQAQATTEQPEATPENDSEEVVPDGYEQVPAKEPDFGRQPVKSIIKKCSSSGQLDSKPHHHHNHNHSQQQQQQPQGAQQRRDPFSRFLENRRQERRVGLQRLRSLLPPSERDRIGAVLERRLSLRPSSEQLEERNILHSAASQQSESERRQQIRLLARKLSYRPTVDELQDRQIIKFSDYVEVTRTEDYDRVIDKPWACLTELDKEKIRKELNAFKSKEMPVHKNSKKYTRYHKS